MIQQYQKTIIKKNSVKKFKSLSPDSLGLPLRVSWCLWIASCWRTILLAFSKVKSASICNQANNVRSRTHMTIWSSDHSLPLVSKVTIICEAVKTSYKQFHRLIILLFMDSFHAELLKAALLFWLLIWALEHKGWWGLKMITSHDAATATLLTPCTFILSQKSSLFEPKMTNKK